MLPNMKPAYGSLIVALKDYFGLKHGQSLAEFSAECKQLTDADKAWFEAQFKGHGISIGGATATA